MQCVVRRSIPLYIPFIFMRRQEEVLVRRLGALGVWLCPTVYVIVASCAPYASVVLPPWTI